MNPRGVTPSNPTEETKRQAELYDYEHENPGSALVLVLGGVVIFFAILLAVLIGSYALPLDLSSLNIHPDCPTPAC